MCIDKNRGDRVADVSGRCLELSQWREILLAADVPQAVCQPSALGNEGDPPSPAATPGFPGRFRKTVWF